MDTPRPQFLGLFGLVKIEEIPDRSCYELILCADIVNNLFLLRSDAVYDGGCHIAGIDMFIAPCDTNRKILSGWLYVGSETKSGAFLTKKIGEKQ